MAYMYDPREESFDTANGAIYEEKNRKEEIYNWGAFRLDLCDLSPEEYMKPTTIIIQDEEEGE